MRMLTRRRTVAGRALLPLSSPRFFLPHPPLFFSFPRSLLFFLPAFPLLLCTVAPSSPLPNASFRLLFLLSSSPTCFLGSQFKEARQERQTGARGDAAGGRRLQQQAKKRREVLAQGSRGVSTSSGNSNRGPCTGPERDRMRKWRWEALKLRLQEKDHRVEVGES